MLLGFIFGQTLAQNIGKYSIDLESTNVNGSTNTNYVVYFNGFDFEVVTGLNTGLLFGGYIKQGQEYYCYCTETKYRLILVY